MKRTLILAAGFGAILALGLVGTECSSGESTGGGGGSGGNMTTTTGTGNTGNTGNTGGSTTTGTGNTGGTPTTTGTGNTGGTPTTTGTGNTGGSPTGAGGTGGTPVTTGTGGSIGTLPLCASPAPDDRSLCNADPSCTKACGVNASGIGVARAQKLCTCSGPAPTGAWACPSNFGACMYPPGADLSCFRLPTPLPACPGDPLQTLGLIRTGTSICTGAVGTCGMVCGSATAMSYQDSAAGKIGYCACISARWQCASVNEWPVVP